MSQRCAVPTRNVFCRHHHLDKSADPSTLIAGGQWKRWSWPWMGIDAGCDAVALETLLPSASVGARCYFKSAATRPTCIKQCINPSCPVGHHHAGICSGYARFEVPSCVLVGPGHSWPATATAPAPAPCSCLCSALSMCLRVCLRVCLCHLMPCVPVRPFETASGPLSLCRCVHLCTGMHQRLQLP